MTSVDDVIHGESGRGVGSTTWERPWAAEILNDPLAVTGDLFVSIPGIDSDKRFGPCGWDPVPTTEGKFYIPGGGESCIVSFDDNRLPWVEAWTPYSGSVKLGGVVIPGPRKTVTSLPAEPVDGEEIDYLANATNGVVWALKYRATSASAHKWELVGGSELSSEVTANQETSSAVYVDLATVGPSVAVPLAGDYAIKMGAHLSVGASAANAVVQLFIGAAEAGKFLTVGNIALSNGSPFVAGQVLNLTAAAVLTLKYASEGAKAVSFSRRMLSVIPIRVG